ncbi:MAG: hypothetical protein WCT28_01375 [Patescibacteria group bacterium]|jgi:hypothetical protein
MNKLSLNELLTLFDSRQKLTANAIILEFSETFFEISGSATKHQVWPDGYISHLEETMNIARTLFQTLNSLRPLEFSESDALFTLFLHDTDKLFRHSIQNGKIVQTLTHDEAQQKFFAMLETQWNYTPSQQEQNALQYVHGEGADYHPTKRVMQPLAAFIHCCDIISARIWFNFGKEHDS